VSRRRGCETTPRVRVTETVYKGKLRPWGKTESSEDYVPLAKRLAAELIDWRTLSTAQGEQDFIFPNSQGGFVDYENFEGAF
jgi:hypothetical protein